MCERLRIPHGNIIDTIIPSADQPRRAFGFGLRNGNASLDALHDRIENTVQRSRDLPLLPAEVGVA